jgi:hypothetical protein
MDLRRTAESVFRDLDGTNGPGLTTIVGRHASSDTGSLAHSVDVIRIGDIQDNLGVDPSCRRRESINSVGDERGPVAI